MRVMRRKDMTRINLPVNRFVDDDDVTTKEFVKSRTLPLLYVPETLYPCFSEEWMTQFVPVRWNLCENKVTLFLQFILLSVMKKRTNGEQSVFVKTKRI